MCAKNHRVFWYFVCGHILKVGQRSHYREICRCVVRWIIATDALVHVPVFTLAPQSFGGAAVCPVLHTVNRHHLPCSLTFGGTRSWIDIYHRKVTAPVTTAWGKIPHTKCQLIDGTCWLLSRSKPRASCPLEPWIFHIRAAYKCSPILPFVGA